jgi:diguanylate cyclase (GGDEF)-like protein
MKVFMAIILTILYWLIDSYIDMQTFTLSLKDALLLNYPQAHPFLKIAIAAIIMVFMLLKNDKENNNQEDSLTYCTSIMIDAMQNIANIILAPIPLQKQIENIVTILEKDLHVESSFVGEYNENFISVLNTNESLQKFGIKDKFLPHRDNLQKDSLEALVSDFYITKEEFIDKNIKINNKEYRVILHAFKMKNVKQHIGLVGIITNKEDRNDYKNFIEMLSDEIAFIVNLAKKRAELVESQERFKSQFSPMDPDLKIYNNAKLQEILEHERKRADRYGTLLSLIILEIDHIQNLSNIFNEEDVLNLKKEFVALFKKGIRETDTFGKWSNEQQFAIIAPDVDFRGAKSFATKLNNKLKEHRFSKVGKVTCSYGITTYNKQDTMGEFRKRAEKALEEAKERGGNSIEVKIIA